MNGLVDAGCWPDDIPEWVTTVEPVLHVIKRGTPPTVTVTLTRRAT